jgi:hypothetical protein
MPGPDHASFPRLAALNLLTINIFPERESANFTDSLSGNLLTVNYLAAA